MGVIAVVSFGYMALSKKPYLEVNADLEKDRVLIFIMRIVFGTMALVWLYALSVLP